MSRDLKQLRVLLVQEWLYTHAGSERVLEELLVLFPDADVLAGMVTPEMRAAHPYAGRARELWVGAMPGARRFHRWFLPLHAAAFAAFDTRQYDLIISVSHAFGKLVRAHDGARHVCYCLSPPRYLWDLSETYERLGTGMQRWALRTAGPFLRAIDRTGASGVDRFLAISNCVADRVRRCYGRASDVVYPPVRSKPSIVSAPGVAQGTPFLLSLGRLVPYKRVDLAIQAAERLGMRLIVAGDGPDRPRLERLAGSSTEFVGSVSENEAGALLNACAAFVFCAEEDFGIAPLEANAHGRPVVALRRGAAPETLLEGTSGVFFDEPEVTAVAHAIARCLETAWDSQAIQQNVNRFAPERFREGMRAALQSVVDDR